MKRTLQRETWQSWMLLAPALVFLGLFVAWPLLRAVRWSFMDVDLLRPEAAAWAGGEHYGELIRDARFRRAFFNTALFALMVVPLQTVLALFLALWVNRPEPCWRWLRHVFFLPVVVAMPVLAVLWAMLYQPARGGEMGLINTLISSIGLAPRAWLTDPRLALPALAFMSVWQGVGLQMMLFLAGLQSVSRAQVEAALIDGAHAGQRLWHVVLPGLRNTLVFVVLATTILAFRLFVQPYLMTRGGPRDRTLSLIQAIYEMTFLQRDVGRACAAAMLFLLLVILLALLQRLVLREVRS